MIKAVVFDMDGIMFDTERLELESWGYVGDKLNCGFDAKEVAMKSVGLNKKQTEQVFKTYFGNIIDFDTFRDMCMKRMRECIEQNGLPVKEGLRDLLNYLKDNEFKMTVATSSEKERLEYYFQKSGISHFFDEVVHDGMIEHGKPAPDIYLKALEILDVPAEECIAIEDSPAGVLSAHRAGICPVMIPDLISPDEDTKKNLCTQLRNLTEVVPFIQKINNC